MNDAHGKFHPEMAQNGIEQFFYSETVVTPDYFKDFIKSPTGAFTPGDYTASNILRTFTQFNARLYESSILNALNSTLNANFDVIFKVKWNPDTISLGQSEGAGRSIEAIGLDSGTVWSFESLREGSRITGIDTRDITRLINYPGYYATSLDLGERLEFRDNLLPINEGSPNAVTETTFKDIDHSIIPQGQIWAYEEDLSSYTVFTGGQTAGNDFGVSKFAVLHNVNRIFTSCIVGGCSVKIYFARNPVGVQATQSTAVIMTDTLNNVAYSYDSIEQIAKAFRVNGIRRITVVTSRIYRKR